jgi:hypothetical protein
MKGKGCSLIKVISPHLLGVTQKNQTKDVRLTGVSSEIRNGYTRPKRCSYTNILGDAALFNVTIYCESERT